jgi:hypothetical protein
LPCGCANIPARLPVAFTAVLTCVSLLAPAQNQDTLKDPSLLGQSHVRPYPVVNKRL